MALNIVEEAMLKTLAVMTRADAHVLQVEVDMVVDIMKEEMGVTLTSADVRVAAHSEFIEGREIEKYVKSVRKKLSLEDRKRITRTLKKVVLSDGDTHPFEVDMFNKVAKTLELTPAQLVQL